MLGERALFDHICRQESKRGSFLSVSKRNAAIVIATCLFVAWLVFMLDLVLLNAALAPLMSILFLMGCASVGVVVLPSEANFMTKLSITTLLPLFGVLTISLLIGLVIRFI